MKEVFKKFRIQEEAELLSYFEKVFNLRAINKLLSFKSEEREDRSLPFYMRGYYLPIYQEFGGALYDNCRKTSEKLGFAENNIEFYVSNDPNFNSSSIASRKKDIPHIVIINRGLIERVNPEELSFVIGHEIGHLVYQHADVTEVFRFVYPNYENLPPILQKLYEFWSQLGEISADRIGYLASRNLEASTRALFKLSSGIDEKNFNLSHENITNIAERTFNEMQSHPSHVSATHPANPIRIKALAALHRSELIKTVDAGGEIVADKKLNEEIDEIVKILRKVPFNDREWAELDFVGSAGMLIMMADKEINATEHNYLINILSRYIHWPPAYLEHGFDQEKPVDKMKGAAKWIIENCPWRTRDLLKQLFPIIIRDQVIHDTELNTFMKIGIEELKVPSSEIIDVFLEGTKKWYSPLG